MMRVLLDDVDRDDSDGLPLPIRSIGKAASQYALCPSPCFCTMIWVPASLCKRPCKLHSVIQYKMQYQPQSEIQTVLNMPLQMLQHTLSYLIGRLAASRIRWIKNGMINAFIRFFPVNMQEARVTRPDDFDTFNAFFARDLHSDARPIAPGQHTIVAPVDGICREYGQDKAAPTLQVKGKPFALPALLAHQSRWVTCFQGGAYMNVYLAPHAYHGVHMPTAGHCIETIHVPGSLFSVRDRTVARVPDVFSRNERLIYCFDTPHGPLAIIMVGALIVGSIVNRWQGQVGAQRFTMAPQIRVWQPNADGPKAAMCLKKGDKLGYFQMGSTVIVLFGPGQVQWDPRVIQTGRSMRLGEKVGQHTPINNNG